ncbi:MAG: dihydroorotate dehydrogenase electron transfer subunit, partial [Deltaproteobacteria bacterium]|nr:dihydroorotate dehydrogenase electron transfer subunit [Deltaproteobacteria bacterium]
LGNGFPRPSGSKKLIAVAGGIGVAGLYLFVKEYPHATLLFGAKDSVEARLSSGIKRFPQRTRLATEDGSLGKKGLVTDILKEELTRDSLVYACGPSGMLKVVAGITRKAGVVSYVSLERSMACGVGACLGCAVKTGHTGKTEGAYRMVCSDGPVFSADDIMWEFF